MRHGGVQQKTDLALEGLEHEGDGDVFLPNNPVLRQIQRDENRISSELEIASTRQVNGTLSGGKWIPERTTLGFKVWGSKRKCAATVASDADNCFAACGRTTGEAENGRQRICEPCWIFNSSVNGTESKS